MSKRILFEELVARREQREADKLKIGELRIPDSDRTLEAKMPPKKAVLELYGELAAAQDAAAALQCGNHALYAVCPQLQDRELQREIGTAEDPMRTVDALFSLMEQDKLGGPGNTYHYQQCDGLDFREYTDHMECHCGVYHAFA